MKLIKIVTIIIKLSVITFSRKKSSLAYIENDVRISVKKLSIVFLWPVCDDEFLEI